MGASPPQPMRANVKTAMRKNAAKLNEIGAELSELYPVKLLPSDFKKKGGYLRSIELSREYGLYRQNYCGCVFSKQEAQRRENEKIN